jgi:rod shape-determining protein MreC
MGFLRRHPILITVIFFLFAVQLLPLSFKERQSGDPFSRFILNLAYYPQKFVFILTGGIVELWQSYLDLVGVKEENRRLKAEIEKLRQEKFRLWEVELQNERLKKLLEFKENSSYRVLTANIIARSPSELRSQVVIIDRGKRDGISEGMPVTTYEGIVGRVFLVGERSAEVILITDPISAVDAYIHRTRARGIVKGITNGCVMEYIEKKSDVSIGDKVISSGKDGFFPKGVVIGTVIDIETTGGLTRARVSPDLDLNSLEEVLVVLKSPENVVLSE